MATVSLLVQGGTIGPLASRLFPAVDPAEEDSLDEERTQVKELAARAAAEVEDPPTDTSDDADGASAKGTPVGRYSHRVRRLEAARAALLDARDDGIFDAEVLSDALVRLDAEQVALETFQR